jgi:group I intron endonuclease
MVTAGVYLLMRASPIFEYSDTVLAIITLVGCTTALFAASIALMLNDIKKVIAYSTMSQLGYTFLACGISGYDIAIFHIVNHGFFVRQHRYWNPLPIIILLLLALNDFLKSWAGPSIGNLLKVDILTYIFAKFKYNLRGERSMKMNSCQNCIIVINNFYSFETSTQKKVDDGPQIMSRCRIEKISSPYHRNHSGQIVSILKVGKLGKVLRHKILIYQLFLPLFLGIDNIILSIQYGCRIGYQAKALGNAKDRLFLTNSKECRISHSSYKIYNKNINRIHVRSYSTQNYNNLNNLNNIKIFKQECKGIFKLNSSVQNLINKLIKFIPRWVSLLGDSYKTINFIRHYIYKRSWIWAIKKHKISHKKIYNLYFKPNQNNFSLFLHNKDIKNLYDKNFFYLAKEDLIFINIEKKYENILKKLNNLTNGIYLFWVLDNPYKCYLGSSDNLKRRFKVHYKNSLTTNKHPKFYNYIKKYGWSKLGFKIIELVDDKSTVIEREQYWLNKLFNSEEYKKNTFNLLKNANNWLGYKHNIESKIFMSKKKKGIKLSEEHKKNISLGKLGDKHHYFGKKRGSLSMNTKLKMSLALKNHPSLTKPKTEEMKSKLSKEIILTDKDNNIIKIFKGTIIAMKELKITHKKLKDYLNNNKLYKEQFYIKYKIK